MIIPFISQTGAGHMPSPIETLMLAMDSWMVRTILERYLPHEGHYPYYKDKFALERLWSLGQDEATIGELKRGPEGALLNKPGVQAFVRQHQGQPITREALDLYWPEETLPFRLTFTGWASEQSGGYQQTSRKGHNLVVQLNFDKEHHRDIFCWKRESRCTGHDAHYLLNTGHPVRRNKLFTLAWVRIDLDMLTKEALIEEVQSDWISYSDELLHEVKKAKGTPSWAAYEMEEYVHGEYGFRQYLKTLKPYRKIWGEAVLAAALDILIFLNIKRVYYHTYKTGQWLKDAGTPPVSVYTKLPRSMGFKETEERPEFLFKDRELRHRIRRLKNKVPIRFQVLDLVQPKTLWNPWTGTPKYS